jgi:hypothetical protein
MAAKKPTKGDDRHKPSRMVRLAEPLAVALEAIADEQFNSLTEQVKIAVREYLEKLGRMPKPGSARPPKS